MATYIQGLTDYIPQIQPFKPDYNFLSNVLQTRQGKYDANYNQLSSVYTSLFNAPMSRESDIKRKDEFFKNIDQNIKKISGLDLSLQQNVDAASKVFQPFYDDKNMVNDMVKTRQIQNGLEAHERFKNCLDPKKCGDLQAWNEGLQEIQYKAEEFKKTTDEEALNFSIPEYTPFLNWKKEAIKGAAALKYDVTQDRNTGQWIVSDTNGVLVKGGLYSIYQSMYGDDPRVQANYDTKAYVKRKSTVAGMIPQYGSEEAAEKAYINDVIANSTKRVTKLQNRFFGYSEAVEQKATVLQQKKDSIGLIPDEEDNLIDVLQIDESLKKVNDVLETTNNKINNDADNTDIRTLRARADAATAFELNQADIMDLASTMSMRGAKSQIKMANPYTLAKTTSDLSLRNALTLAEYNRTTGLLNISAKHAADLDKYNFEHGIKSGAITTKPTVMEDASWETYSQDPTKSIEQDQAVGRDFKQKQVNSSEDFIFNAFKTAKLAASTNNASAKNYLNSTFGYNWAKFTTKQDLVNYLKSKRKGSVDVFNTTITALDQSKNPHDDLAWAKPLLNNGKGSAIMNIKILGQAAEGSAEHIASVNKGIVKSLKGQAGVGGKNYILYNADLLLTSDGYLNSNKEEFIAKYNQRYGGKGGDAEDVYDELYPKFVETYRTTKGASLSQGFDKSGTGTYTGRALKYTNLSPSKPQDPGLTNAISLLTDLSNTNNFNAVNGLPYEENIKNVDADKSQAIKNLLPEILSDISTTDKKKANLSFDLIESPVAGNNPDLSSVTLRFNSAYMAKFVGTKANPKALYAYKDEIADGNLTFFYNNKEVQTTTTNSLQANPLTTILKTKGVSFDHWPKGGKTVTTYDESNGMFNAVRQRYVYDPRTFKGHLSAPEITQMSLAEFNSFYENEMDNLERQEKANIKWEQEHLAPYYKNKQPK